jgi:hypothetical protein
MSEPKRPLPNFFHFCRCFSDIFASEVMEWCRRERAYNCDVTGIADGEHYFPIILQTPFQAVAVLIIAHGRLVPLSMIDEQILLGPRPDNSSSRSDSLSGSAYRIHQTRYQQNH